MVFRKSMALFLQNYEATHKLGGAGYTVEIDESSFKRKRKYNRGAYDGESQWVFGITERGGDGRKETRFWLVPDRKRQTLFPLIFANVEPGTTIMSDSYATYETLREHNNYLHLQINHSISFTDGNVHTQSIEAKWSGAKGSLNRGGRTRHKYIQLKLDEYIVRQLLFKGNQDKAFHRLGRILARYGVVAKRQLEQ